MKKRLDFNAEELEVEILDRHCKAVGRTRTDVLRELIRNLEIKKSRPKGAGLESH